MTQFPLTDTSRVLLLAILPSLLVSLSLAHLSAEKSNLYLDHLATRRLSCELFT